MPSHYNKKPRNHPNGAGISRQSKIPKIPKTGRIGAVGAVLKKIGDILGGSKARRLEDRRKADKGIEYRAGSNGHEPRFKLSPTKGNPEPRASDWIRTYPAESGRRYRKDRRRKSKFASEKRKARDRGEMALKVAVPAGAISVAAGIYSRKNKDKNNGKVEAAPDYTKGGTLKLRQLTPDEIRDRFHTNTERIKKSQKTSIPQSTYVKGMKRVKDQIKAAVKKSNYHYQEGTETGFSGGAFGTAESRAKHRAISKKVGKKATALRKFTERDKKFR